MKVRVGVGAKRTWGERTTHDEKGNGVVRTGGGGRLASVGCWEHLSIGRGLIGRIIVGDGEEVAVWRV